MAGADTQTRSPLEAARALAPLIRAHADEIERERELPRAVFEAIYDAGIFRLLIPKSLGGTELDLPTYTRVIEEIGYADASTAWAVNQGTVFATFAARMPRELATLIFNETPRGVVSNTPAPHGTAIPVEGGYRVSGRLGFSTGCRHAAWRAAYARVMDGEKARRRPSGEVDARYCFVPAGEAEIVDTWHTQGLRGTATHHFEVKDVFVPEERTLIVAEAESREPGPLYVYPRTLQFASGDSAIALGTARRALDELIELAGGKRPRGDKNLLRDQPMIQQTVGQAEAQLRAGRALLYETVREVWESVCATGELTLDQRASMRLATTHGMRVGKQVVDLAYGAAGSTAIFAGNPIQRCFQDIHVVTQHIQGRPMVYESMGRYYLGLDPDWQRL